MSVGPFYASTRVDGRGTSRVLWAFFVLPFLLLWWMVLWMFIKPCVWAYKGSVIAGRWAYPRAVAWYESRQEQQVGKTKRRRRA